MDAEDAFETSKIVAVSTISAWEIAILHRRSRITLATHPIEWLRDLEETRGLRVLPITTEVALRAAELHEILRDPIDCLIAATALTHGVPLVTKDERIQRSGVVATIW